MPTLQIPSLSNSEKTNSNVDLVVSGLGITSPPVNTDTAYKILKLGDHGVNSNDGLFIYGLMGGLTNPGYSGAITFFGVGPDAAISPEPYTYVSLKSNCYGYDVILEANGKYSKKRLSGSNLLGRNPFYLIMKNNIITIFFPDSGDIFKGSYIPGNLPPSLYLWQRYSSYNGIIDFNIHQIFKI